MNLGLVGFGMREIHDQAAAKIHLERGESLKDVVFQDVDLQPFAALLRERDVEGTVFLGCELALDSLAEIVGRGGIVFPKLRKKPWEAYRTSLYTASELFDVFDADEPCTYCDTLDARVWRHWRDEGGAHPHGVMETLARRLHDHSIYEAMTALLQGQEKVVAVMGGHSMKRDEPAFAKVARLSQILAERGYFLASGGGPGAMEATHLGAWFAGKPAAELNDAVAILAKAPLYKDRGFLSQAFRVRAKYPYEDTCPPSLGIPTWLYGHEPPNPFATHIAKFFANSVREDGLVTIATHGIVFAPGSAGTIQEIFQDAAQNHYGTANSTASAMVFMDEDYWTKERPVYELLKTLSEGRPYAKLLTIGDDIDELVAFIESHPPVKVPDSGWNVCGLHCAK